MASRERPHSPRCAEFERSLVAKPPGIQREVFVFSREAQLQRGAATATR